MTHELDSSRANIGTALLDIPLDQIDDNPYQPRQDYEFIQDLADDIARNGLLQIPKGRRMPDGRVQLQYGHRRLRAIRLLGWPTMPLEVETLVDDRDMAIRAWVENHNRQDFTALDQARYFRHLMDEGWTQQQIASQLGLARPTVSNAVRLLRLPDDLQTQVASAGLSGRQAEALLSFMEIPQDIKDRAESYWDTNLRPSVVLHDAVAGASSDDIRKKTADLLKRYTQTVHDRPWYAVPVAGEGIESSTCPQCPHAIKRDSVFCPKPTCFELKRRRHALTLLEPVTEACGVPVADNPYYNYNEHEKFRYKAHPQDILDATPRCPNLRLVIMNYDGVVRQNADSPGAVPGHPDIGIACQKPGNHCRCLAQRDRAEQAANPDRTSPARLKREIIAPAASALAAELAKLPPGLLRIVTGHARTRTKYDELVDGRIAVIVEPDGVSDEDLTIRTAENILTLHLSEFASPEKNRRIATELLSVAGIHSPWMPLPNDETAYPPTFPPL